MEQIYTDYGKNKNQLVVISATYESNLTTLFSSAASQYGTPNPPTAPYVLAANGGNNILTAIGSYPYTPHMKLVSPLGKVDSISWYTPTPSGYSYNKLVSILTGYGISKDPVPVDEQSSTMLSDLKFIDIVKVTSCMIQLIAPCADKYTVTVQSVNGQTVRALNVRLAAGSNSVGWNRLNPGIYIISVQGNGNKIHKKSFILH